jgi:hypothetical protein
VNACTENRNAASCVKKRSLFASVTWSFAELVGLLGSRYRVDLDEILLRAINVRWAPLIEVAVSLVSMR